MEHKVNRPQEIWIEDVYGIWHWMHVVYYIWSRCIFFLLRQTHTKNEAIYTFCNTFENTPTHLSRDDYVFDYDSLQIPSLILNLFLGIQLQFSTEIVRLFVNCRAYLKWTKYYTVCLISILQWFVGVSFFGWEILVWIYR